MGFSLGGIVSAISGVTGLLDSFNRNKGANRLDQAAIDRQSRAAARDDELYKKGLEWQEKLRKIYERSSKEGQWDYKSRGQSIKNEMADARETALGSTTAALRTAGYKPGDTVTDSTLARINSEADRSLIDQLTELRSRLPIEEMAALEALNPARLRSSDAGSQVAGYLALAQNERNKAGDPASALATILPFLNKQNKKAPAEAEIGDIDGYYDNGLRNI